MAQTLIPISLDFYDNKIVCINAKQGDNNSRYIEVTCTDRGKPYILDKTTTVAFIRASKPDGRYIFNNAEITNNGKVLVELTPQMLAVAGKCRLDLMLLDVEIGINSNDSDHTCELIATDDGDGNVVLYTVSNVSSEEASLFSADVTVTTSGYDYSILSTMEFYINVKDYPVNGAEIVSTDEYDALMAGVAEMVVIKEQSVSTLNELVDVKNQFDKEEEERQSNEELRKANEEIRIQNEKDRQVNADNVLSEFTSDVNQVVSECETATKNANDAAKSATNATNATDEAIANAESATKRANDAASICEGIVDQSGVILKSEKGVANGVATLDGNTLIPNTQINTQFVDSDKTVIISGETLNTILGKIAAYMNAFDNMPIVHTGTSDPSNSLGNNGDYYLKLLKE